MLINKVPYVASKYEKHAERIDKELSVIREIIVGGRATTRNIHEDGSLT
jgi:hypothetical protein